MAVVVVLDTVLIFVVLETNVLVVLFDVFFWWSISPSSDRASFRAIIMRVGDLP
jgi:hypothetical protein